MSQREDGRRVKVVLVNQPRLTSVSQASSMALEPQHLTHIGNITVESKTTWDALDTKIINTLKVKCNETDELLLPLTLVPIYFIYLVIRQKIRISTKYGTQVEPVSKSKKV